MTSIKNWQPNAVDLQLIGLALDEDLSPTDSDVTTALVFPKTRPQISQASIVSKHLEPIIICGLPVMAAVLAKLDPSCVLTSAHSDGIQLAPGAVLLTLTGPIQSLLKAERIILNFLQHLCAIASLTAKFVNKITHTHAQILDTRKTLPGFRHLEKYAVLCGGGGNHRLGLYDAIMLKDNHIDWSGGIATALKALPDTIQPTMPVLVEVRNLAELEIVLKQGLGKVSRILLDNMSPCLLATCVQRCRGKISTEASGNIGLDNVVPIAESGVDFISIGQLTHSAGHVDLSLQAEIVR